MELKRFLPALLCLTVVPAYSQTIEVKETANARITSHTWETDYGSYDRTNMRSKSLEIKATNISSKPEQVSLHAYYIGKQQATREMRILEVCEFNETIQPVSNRIFKAFSGEHADRTENYAALGEKWSSGFKLAGWIVAANSDGKLVFLKASSSSLESLYRDAAAFGKLCDEFNKETGK